MAERRAGSTPAIATLIGAGTPHRVHQVGHDPSVTAYGREAAAALQVDPARVFKTLVCSVGLDLVIAVVPVTGEVNLKAVAASRGAKTAAMADPAAAERATGYVVGGISPIGQKKRLPTLIDRSATSWETIFVSAGRRGLELELSAADLVTVAGGQFADIAASRSG